ncbi:MAG: betaine--homocysteine S-methyltransferase [Anaerolineales bacterium]|nr:betaine--homocysteine S-methyltransferase [Chloroflexota bacterium]MBL7163323.1 betaine--homocysteine S-methyltransferase [Anaerolineales bacterium]
MNPIKELLTSGEPILLDGAMGTMLMDAGLEQGDPPDEWNVRYPERIKAIHQAYIDAGSQLILTNSFGGTRFRLEMHNLQERVYEFNKAAAKNARAVADAASHTVVVAGDIGPTGQLFEPMGLLTFDDAKAAFAEQARGLADGGADVFWIETMSDLNEVKAAIAGIRSVSDLPIIATMSFDTHGHTMMGISPAKFIEAMGDQDVLALGANCGTGSDELELAVKAIREANPDIVLVAKGNAGIPHVVAGGEIVYDGSPEVMAEYALNVREIGASLIGGCCGSTPEHIKAMAEALGK